MSNLKYSINNNQFVVEISSEDEVFAADMKKVSAEVLRIEERQKALSERRIKMCLAAKRPSTMKRIGKTTFGKTRKALSVKKVAFKDA